MQTKYVVLAFKVSRIVMYMAMYSKNCSVIWDWSLRFPRNGNWSGCETGVRGELFSLYCKNLTNLECIYSNNTIKIPSSIQFVINYFSRSWRAQLPLFIYPFVYLKIILIEHSCFAHLPLWSDHCSSSRPLMPLFLIYIQGLNLHTQLVLIYPPMKHSVKFQPFPKKRWGVGDADLRVTRLRDLMSLVFPKLWSTSFCLLIFFLPGFLCLGKQNQSFRQLQTDFL